MLGNTENVESSHPNWHCGTSLCWRCTVFPVWPLLASSSGSNKSPVSSGPCLMLQLCELNLPQTGAAEYASMHWNSWDRSSVLTGDDITWQVFFWLMSCSAALTHASPPRLLCRTRSELRLQNRRGSEVIRSHSSSRKWKGWCASGGLKNAEWCYIH